MKKHALNIFDAGMGAWLCTIVASIALVGIFTLLVVPAQLFFTIEPKVVLNAVSTPLTALILYGIFFITLLIHTYKKSPV